jgi:hypothetical protein
MNASNTLNWYLKTKGINHHSICIWVDQDVKDILVNFYFVPTAIFNPSEKVFYRNNEIQEPESANSS